MDKRFFVFLALSMFVLVGSQAIFDRLYPPPKPVAQKPTQENTDSDSTSLLQQEPQLQQMQQPEQEAAKAESQDSAPPQQTPSPASGATPANEKRSPSVESSTPPLVNETDYPLRYLGLGSLDPNSDARALVTLSTHGGSIVRLELNNPQYQDIQDNRGYLGHLVGRPHSRGWEVQYVGRGTPAEIAGLRVGDVIERATLAGKDKAIGRLDDLERLLEESKVGETLRLEIIRQSQSVAPLTITLTPRPLEIMRPEMGSQPLADFGAGLHDPFSLLLTLSRIDEVEKLPGERSIKGAELRDVQWNVAYQDPLTVEFELPLPAYDLVLTKRYELARVPSEQLKNPDFKAYHIMVEITIENRGTKSRDVAYLLDGPTGMPVEGWWYSRKIGRTWSGGGLRDVAAHSLLDGANLISTAKIVEEETEAEEDPSVNLQLSSGEANPLAYIGVETQYFAAILIPLDKENDESQQYKSYRGIVVGDQHPDKSKLYLTNVTSQVASVTHQIDAGEKISQKFQFFTGPKKRKLLEQYDVPGFPEPVNLSELIYYGWAIWGLFARPLTDVLNFFYGIIPNYGIAIILLTVLVRLCMFPLSRKQALNAQKMQELQPEIKKITEKYKGDMEKRSKALQELYRKHHYNPLAGCLPLFIQMPIFIGLYRALMTDVALRQAPLVSKAFPWADNLAAPDMLLRWDHLIPIPFLTAATGWLGPYLNILPLITVFLFILQQKLFMPPPTDEQSAMQQKIMKYMMVFMGFMFFKVPSGLCLYFIVSSLWGIGERKFLPKTKQAEPAMAAAKTTQSPTAAMPESGSGKGSAGKAKKKKRRKK